METKRCYICIDLKSYYASVECVERGLDPLTTNLVVADPSRTSKTICLAVTPSLKAYGISGRARLFEVEERVREINARRLREAPGRCFISSSWQDPVLRRDPSLALDYIVAAPRMALYMARSTYIYSIYMKYIAPEDIYVYSVDEVFLDVTAYLTPGGPTARELAVRLIREVLESTGITATAGIGSNLYLCKVAMDIVAKRVPADENGVRIAELDEFSYRKQLWAHRPLTDFWRVGPGYREKLEANGLYTMGDIACCSVGGPGEYYNEALLYRLFGVNAQFLIDHAWGWEPCTLAEIHAYQPESSSLGSGQVLQRPYAFGEAHVVLREMAEALAQDLLAKGLDTDQIVVTIGYDAENLKDAGRRALYMGKMVRDHYGRALPKHAHGSRNLDERSALPKELSAAALAVFDGTVDPGLLIRRVNITANHTQPVGGSTGGGWEQMGLFPGPCNDGQREDRERERQRAVLSIKEKYGKNAILSGTSFREGATARERNRQIGGHRA